MKMKMKMSLIGAVSSLLLFLKKFIGFRKKEKDDVENKIFKEKK